MIRTRLLVVIEALVAAALAMLLLAAPAHSAASGGAVPFVPANHRNGLRGTGNAALIPARVPADNEL